VIEATHATTSASAFDVITSDNVATSSDDTADVTTSALTVAHAQNCFHRHYLSCHIACHIDKLSIKLYLLCKIDDPYKCHYDCLLASDFQIDTDFDEAVENISSTAIVKD